MTRYLAFSRVLTVALIAVAAGSAQADRIFLVNSGGSGNVDSVWELNPNDGSIVTKTLIVDSTLGTPIQAIDSGRRTILVSDQIRDGVFEYDYAGNFLRTVVGPGQGFDNVRGIARRGDHLYVLNAGGALGASVQRVNLDGTGLTTWASLAAGASPWGIAFRGNDVLVSDSTSDDILRFGLDGSSLGTWYASNGTTGANFPQQIYVEPGGGVLAAGFSSPLTGVFQLGSDGSQTSHFAVNTGIRGTLRLGNGKILWTGGTRFGTIDPSTGAVVDIFTGTTSDSFRFVSYAPDAVPEPATLALVGAGLLALRRRRR